MCVNIQEYKQCYLVFYITIKSYAELLKWPTYVCMYVHMCVCVCVCVCIRICVSVHTHVSIYGHQPEGFSDPQSSLPPAKGGRGRMLRYISYDQQRQIF